MCSTLITGGMGFIGASLARKLLEKGQKVIATYHVTKTSPFIEDIKDKIELVNLDVSNWVEVISTVKSYQVTTIFHLAYVLTVPSERNVWRAYKVNVDGFYNVLEAARIFNAKIMYTSSTGTFADVTGKITDDSPQRPYTFYGICKVFNEMLGKYYRRKFGVDFRCLRLPPVVGPAVKTPGAAQYNSWMIEHAALGKPYEAYVDEETETPIVYYKDVINGLIKLSETPAEKIKTVVYNIVWGKIKAGQLAEIIKRYVPDAKIIFKPDPWTVKHLARYKSMEIDDSRAREEWGWKPEYSPERMVKDFIEEVRLLYKEGKIS